MNRKTHVDSTARIAVALVTLLALSAGAVGVTATESEVNAPDVPPEDALVVSVHENGDADVSLVTTFDLTAAAEKRAFRQLERNETKRRQLRQRFVNNLRPVVAAVGNRTGRDMTTTNPTVTALTAENGTTGVVTVSVTWTNLAAERDGSLVVEEPFASGFETARAFVLRAPDGYAVSELTPTPDSRRDGRAIWNNGSSLDGFRAEMEPGEASSETTGVTSDGTAKDGTAGDGTAKDGMTGSGTSASTPGFGIALTLAALAASATLTAFGLRRPSVAERTENRRR